MMARRILLHLSALLVGGSLGLVVGWFVHTQFGLDSIFIAIIVAAFIFLSQVLAHALTERTASPQQQASREPVIRGTEPWGWLKPASGIGAGFPLNKECTRLGRGVDMDILLNNASISRRHAQIRRLIDGCLVEDIGSRNGVFVNGTRVTEQSLADGDHVGLGEMKFIFHRVGRTADAAPYRASGPATPVVTSAAGPANIQEAPSARTPEEARAAAFKTSEMRKERDSRPFDDTSDYNEHAPEDEHE